MFEKLLLWVKNNVTEDPNCLACRLYSGFGLMGIGAYLLAQSKRSPKPIENYTMISLAAAAGVLGLARLADPECPETVVRDSRRVSMPMVQEPLANLNPNAQESKPNPNPKLKADN